VRKHVRLGGVVLLAIAGIVFGLTVSASSAPLARARYGPANARFVVSFRANPETRYLAAVQGPNSDLGNMTNQFSLYVATLGPQEYESVSTDVYPRLLTKENINWFIHDYLFGYHAESWHGLPGAEMNVACRVGDSYQSCPGRIAHRVIISGRVIYELDALHVSESEVQRFFASFSPAASSS
jgi:hypothetical protein